MTVDTRDRVQTRTRVRPQRPIQTRSTVQAQVEATRARARAHAEAEAQAKEQTLKHRWVDNINIIDEHIGLERELLLRLGAGSTVASIALMTFTTAWATKTGAVVSAAMLAALLIMFFRSWYVLVGIAHEREELSAKIDGRVLVSFAPSIMTAVQMPITHRESSWPALFVIPQAVMLGFTVLGITYHLAASQTLFGSITSIVLVALPLTLMTSVATVGALAWADRKQ